MLISITLLRGRQVSEVSSVLVEYLREAMRRAKYKILEDGTYYGWVEELPGVWASAGSAEECREELESVVGDWLFLGLKMGHEIVPLGDIDPNTQVTVVRSV
jgi:predicted RNase H-like HicB family nuclease